MALPATLSTPSTFQVKLLGEKPRDLHKNSLIHGCNRKGASRALFIKPKASYTEPNNIKRHINNAKVGLWETVPTSVKEFPWKKAEDLLVQRLLLLGQKALKWSLFGLFIASSLSDVIFAISRSRELMIPFGLFIGCLVSDFFKETTQDLFLRSQGQGSKLHLLGIGCFFLLLKLISTLQGQVFLLHVANGGLMQVLWVWKTSTESSHGTNGEVSL